MADTIYSGGPILTIDDANPKAEAIAVKDSRIIAVGTMDAVSAHRGDQTRMYDLDGRTLLPGFVDSHGHVVMGGLQAPSANLLAPPDGEVTDIASLQATLKPWADKNAEAVDKVKMIIGFGYDNAQLKELRHPTREETLAELRVLVTIKDGKVIHEADKDTRRGDLVPSIVPFGDPEAAHQFMNAMYGGFTSAKH